MADTNNTKAKPILPQELAELESRINQRIDDKALAHEKATQAHVAGLNSKIDRLDRSFQTRFSEFKDSTQQQMDSVKDSMQKQNDDMKESQQRQNDDKKESLQRRNDNKKESLPTQIYDSICILHKQSSDLNRSFDALRSDVLSRLDRNNSEELKRLRLFGIVGTIVISLIVALGGLVIAAVFSSS